MAEHKGFMHFDEKTRTLRRDAIEFPDILPVPSTATPDDVEAAASPPPMKRWPAFELHIPKGYTLVRVKQGMGTLLVQTGPDLQAEGGGTILREGELWALPDQQAEEQCNHPAGTSKWEWATAADRKDHAKKAEDDE